MMKTDLYLSVSLLSTSWEQRTRRSEHCCRGRISAIKGFSAPLDSTVQKDRKNGSEKEGETCDKGCVAEPEVPMLQLAMSTWTALLQATPQRHPKT
ncbi:hypothetical protein SKAU_G00128300 [Synaphobranchus kaupii]|uniref:Uncharacterized protein n=1 Tax=Synaphobranchus kaupii TaxID=118154 RepID=A0A9Q1FQ47_SYNKA|nr:hypothetical protein SKAU_G00128300 [Synaphobranchus kaupii]